MAQSGIPVPAEEATLPIFDRVLADIGDQQSITNHLSTFSAHVLAIKSMIESVTSRSLILLDEIGSSTEPGEGAALARAVLEQFRRNRRADDRDDALQPAEDLRRNDSGRGECRDGIQRNHARADLSADSRTVRAHRAD